MPTGTGGTEGATLLDCAFLPSAGFPLTDTAFDDVLNFLTGGTASKTGAGADGLGLVGTGWTMTLADVGGDEVEARGEALEAGDGERTFLLAARGHGARVSKVDAGGGCGREADLAVVTIVGAKDGGAVTADRVGEGTAFASGPDATAVERV